jgi:hypothetical protein
MKDPYPAIAEKYDKIIRDALQIAWDKMRRVKSLIALEKIISEQGITGILRLLDSLPDYLNSELRPVLERAILESGRAVISILPSAAVTGPIVYSLVLPSVSNYIMNYSSTLIREISENTREAVRVAISQGVVTGRNPKQIARDFRSVMGLTEHLEKTVQRFKTALETGDISYVNSLSTPSKSMKIAATVKLSQDKIDKMVEDLRLRYVRQRTETIARTESLRALSVGQDQAIRTGQITGAISNQLLKRWLYRKDGRTRDVHISTGENNGWIPMNTPFITPLGPLMFPRDPAGTAENTMNCRCRVAYSLPEDINVIS